MVWKVPCQFLLFLSANRMRSGINVGHLDMDFHFQFPVMTGECNKLLSAKSGVSRNPFKVHVVKLKSLECKWLA